MKRCKNGSNRESLISIKMGGQGCSALLSSYTLLEILMVISIMALLMTITMPAFNDMMKGQGVESAARNICQRLKLARSHAISNREYVAVLMPQSLKNGAWGPSQLLAFAPNYFDRAYRACLVVKHPAFNTYKFKRWISGENWSFLPTGVGFFEIDNDSGVQFGADGRPSNGSMPPPVWNVNFSDLDGGGTIPSPCHAIIFKPTGRSAGLSYINIGEGTFSSSGFVVTNPDAAAFVTVKVDQYTGRVSYGDD